MSDHVKDLTESLERLGFVKVVKADESKGQIRILCRVTDKKAWCEILERIMLNKKGWTEHVCQQYFIKDGRLVYGWNLIINSEDPYAAAKSICKQLVVQVDVDTFPLRGAYRPTGSVFNPAAPGEGRGGASQKGAFPIGGK